MRWQVGLPFLSIPMQKFPGLISRCKMPARCTASIACIICIPRRAIVGVENVPCGCFLRISDKLRVNIIYTLDQIATSPYMYIHTPRCHAPLSAEL